MSDLIHRERPADGHPEGLLILHHGRGADELDLLGLADALDPARRLHVVTPRAPLALPGLPGWHWYVVPRVGYPDPRTFKDAYARLAGFHDAVWQRTAIPAEQTVLGGFSMGAVMSYALGLGPDRPTPAGVLAFSGFIPTVTGWSASPRERAATRVFIAHGRLDPVIDVSFARAARELLHDAGLRVEYHEADMGHQIDASHAERAARWLTETLAPRAAG